MIAVRQRAIWTVLGAIFDTAFLGGIWLVLNAIGPLQHDAEAWLDAIGLVCVPWLVHVVVLPSLILGYRGRLTIILLRTILFVGLAALLIPIIGVFVALSIGLPLGAIFFITKYGGPSIASASTDWIGSVLGGGVWIATATIVGAAIGYLLHTARPERSPSHPMLLLSNHPRARSDVLGGMSAAFLAFGGMLVAVHFRLFTRPVDIPTDWMHQLSTVPRLSTTIVIGVFALMPHLLMVGRDLFGSTPQEREIIGWSSNRGDRQQYRSE